MRQLHLQITRHYKTRNVNVQHWWATVPKLVGRMIAFICCRSISSRANSSLLFPLTPEQHCHAPTPSPFDRPKAYRIPYLPLSAFRHLESPSSTSPSASTTPEASPASPPRASAPAAPCTLISSLLAGLVLRLRCVVDKERVEG